MLGSADGRYGFVCWVLFWWLGLLVASSCGEFDTHSTRFPLHFSSVSAILLFVLLSFPPSFTPSYPISRTNTASSTRQSPCPATLSWSIWGYPRHPSGYAFRHGQRQHKMRRNDLIVTRYMFPGSLLPIIQPDCLYASTGKSRPVFFLTDVAFIWVVLSHFATSASSIYRQVGRPFLGFP